MQSHLDYQDIRLQAIKFMLERQWKQKTGKSRYFEQSLYDHTLIELDALITLLPILRKTISPTLTVEEEQILLASIVVHDVGKELDEWQEYVLGRRNFLSDVNRELTEEIVPIFANRLGFTGVEEMISNILLHMRYERSTAKVLDRVLFGEHNDKRWKTLADIVDAIDNVCSAKGLFAGLRCLEERSCLSNHLRITYHMVQIRGVSTTLLHRAAIDAFIGKGWNPLLHYSNGTIYVASSAEQIEDPQPEAIHQRLSECLQDIMPKNIANLVVGIPTASMLPKPELFDHSELSSYLSAAARKVNRKGFSKKPETARRKVVQEYLLHKNDQTDLTSQRLAEESERISVAQPEMCIFKLFKSALSEDLIGDVPTIEAEYDAVFGRGAYKDLNSTSTLMPAREMALVIDRFWELKGAQFGLNVTKIEHLLDHSKRESILINTLTCIANKIYASLPEEKRPTRSKPADIARCFLVDLVYPAQLHDLAELADRQMKAYAITKSNAKSEKGLHLCPICNQFFEEGVSAKADFLENPESHTNRAKSHGSGGKAIVICNACKFERFTQQLLLGTRASSTLIIMPRMNVGHSSGEQLRKKVIRIQQLVTTIMSEANPKPDVNVSFNRTYSIARRLKELDIYRLSAEEIVELLTNEPTEETLHNNRKKLQKELEQHYDVDSLTTDLINAEWGTDFETVEEAIAALIDNLVDDDEARIIKAKAFNLNPQFYIACQTPHMILVPLVNPVSMNKDSDTNAGIRELHLMLVLGLSLDCTVAIARTGEVITFEGGEGVARVPPIPALRDLIGSEWVSIESAKKWLDAISATALLANGTDYPERSNLYQILKSPTMGHILRRIEQQSNSGLASIHHFQLLEQLKEVLK
ncbi:MAG: hypothetical protein KIT45_11665 [Fimbriimonadia bacterium]|nr:hypothetical protein [Fimbriimonadia bacterium]